jgi:hypothetical protein
VRPNSRLRFLAWLCVAVVLLAAFSPGGLPQAHLAPAGPVLGEPVPANLVRAAEETSPPDLLVMRGVAARAPPLA